MADFANVIIVDTSGSIIAFLDSLESQTHTDPLPYLYCDLEGVKLSRHGSVSIFQIYVSSLSCTFLIDIHVLSEKAFLTPNESGMTLKSLLESDSITKVFFDVRNDADALYAHFGIRLQGVHDLQLMEVASRRRSDKAMVSGLAKCIENHLGLNSEAIEAFKSNKQRGLSLFAPEHGGSYKIFNARPLCQEIIDYCTQDVTYLPLLYNEYYHSLSGKWFEQATKEARKRVATSESETYDSEAGGKFWSPWASQKTMEAYARKKNKALIKDKEKTVDNTAVTATTSSIDRVPNPQSIAIQVAATSPKPAESPFPTVKKTKGIHTPSILQQHLPVRTRLTRQSSKQTPSSHIESNKGPSLKTSVLTSVTTPPPSNILLWTCTICLRSMQLDQKIAHLSGKPHNNRAKIQSASNKTDAIVAKGPGSSLPLARNESSVDIKGSSDVVGRSLVTSIPSKNSSTAINNETDEQKPQIGDPQGVNSDTTPFSATDEQAIKQAPNTKRAKKTKKSKEAKAATKEKKRQPHSHTTYPHQTGLPHPPDTFFVGFGGSTLSSSLDDEYRYGDTGGVKEYGLCDSDCGWCGRCMDGVDI